ncbi:hypothetical protein ACOXXX_12755 [Thalassococcus sp. BH17M4-6]|uniref:hypothetical protein n=1 Tax=Thalassococcus sp. BH17M4-6 TaxID=3413148 RepID=UPI003BE44B08
MDWMQENAEQITLWANIAMVMIWLVYLQLMYMGIRRANRAVIHIDKAASEDEDARCLVANMGSDTVYVLAVKVDLDCANGVHEALVTDRMEKDGPLGGDFREGSSKGPLRGGEVVDIGSFGAIVERAARQMDADIRVDTCRGIEITVVVAAQQAHKLLGGYKRFEVEGAEGGPLTVRSDDVLTRQISGWKRRRQLRREIAC